MTRRLGLVLFALSCSSSAPTAAPSSSTLPPGVIARSGAESVAAATVERIAARREVPPSVATELAVTDAAFAAAARDRLPPGTVRSIERAAAARAVLETLARDVAALPPATDAELNEVRAERWVDLDRPDAVRTSHAVILNDKPERAADALALAEKLRLALASVTTGPELIRIAQAFPAGDFRIRAEALPFVTADGRVFARTETGLAARPGTFDAAFARAALTLTEVGELGPVTESSFGFHIILLEERLAGVSTPPAGLSTLLGPEVQARRGSKRRRELLEGLRAKLPVQVERAADDLTARVKVLP